MIINSQFANAFATDWIASWNAHDLGRILAHYTADFEMNSPRISQRMGIPSGQLRGQAQVRPYWQGAFVAYPALHFVLHEVFCGTHSITLRYTGAAGGMVAETFVFNSEGLVYQVFANYA